MSFFYICLFDEYPTHTIISSSYLYTLYQMNKSHRRKPPSRTGKRRYILFCGCSVEDFFLEKKNTHEFQGQPRSLEQSLVYIIIYTLYIQVVIVLHVAGCNRFFRTIRFRMNIVRPTHLIYKTASARMRARTPRGPFNTVASSNRDFSWKHMQHTVQLVCIIIIVPTDKKNYQERASYTNMYMSYM